MNLRKLPSGRWQVRVNHHGVQRVGTADTRGEAQLLGASILLEMGGTPGRMTITVADLINAWQPTAGHSQTYAADVKRITGQMPPKFLTRHLQDVTPIIIENAFAQMTAAGLSAHRIKRAHAVLSAAWGTAIRYGWAATNPVLAAHTPTARAADIHAPTTDAVRAILEETEGRPFGLALRVLAVTGMRRGELCGLQWSDIVNDAVIIRRSIAYTSTDGVHQRDTKTGRAGWRTVAIPAALSEGLTAYRDRQIIQAIDHGLPDPLWVFSHDAGVNPWRPDYLTGEFMKIRNRLGLDVRLHDLRHFVATTLLDRGEPPQAVAHRLGHSTVATTLRTYSGWVQATDRSAAAIMGDLLA